MENMKMLLNMGTFLVLLLNSFINYLAKKELEQKFEVLELKIKAFTESNLKELLSALHKNESVVSQKLEFLNQSSIASFNIVRDKQEALKDHIKDLAVNFVNPSPKPFVDEAKATIQSVPSESVISTSTSTLQSLLDISITTIKLAGVISTVVGLGCFGYYSYALLNSTAASVLSLPGKFFGSIIGACDIRAPDIVVPTQQGSSNDIPHYTPLVLNPVEMAPSSSFEPLILNPIEMLPLPNLPSNNSIIPPSSVLPLQTPKKNLASLFDSMTDY